MIDETHDASAEALSHRDGHPDSLLKLPSACQAAGGGPGQASRSGRDP